MNRYLSFVLAVLVLTAIPQLLSGDPDYSDWKELPPWQIDIMVHDDGIEVMCVSGCYYETASVMCRERDGQCKVGVSESGVGGGSNKPFIVDEHSVFKTNH